MPSSYLILDIESVPDLSIWSPPPKAPERLIVKGISHEEEMFFRAALDLVRSKKPLHQLDAERAAEISFRGGFNEEFSKAFDPYLPPPIQEKGSFAPHYAQIPIVIGCVWLDSDLHPKKIGAMKIAKGADGEKKLLSDWNAFMAREKPAIVTWYGRGFDMPVLMLRSMKHGIAMPWYFNEKYRHRFSEEFHSDLCDVMADYGAIRGVGMKLDNIAKLLGLPGKHEDADGTDMDGSKVAELYQAGLIDKIGSYCLSDTLQTAFIFQRWRFLKGKLQLIEYQTAARALYQMAAALPETQALSKLINTELLYLGEIKEP
jgi:predicted PolB exonuclease-like 3'-5' exonuclease